MNRRKRLTLLIVLAITVCIFIIMGVSAALGQNTSASGTNFLGSILRPVQKLFTNVGTSVTDFFSFASDMGRFKEENETLKARVDELEQENRSLAALQEENARLREWLDFKEANPSLDIAMGEVIAKDPGVWFNVFTIDKGTNDGIQKDDVVVNTRGLVGRVMDVGANWAKVLSIIDEDSSVGAINSRTRDIAIVDGELLLGEEGRCKLNYISKDASLVVGDTIETSGLGGVYPPGILIGTVVEIKSDPQGFSQYAVIEPSVDFKHVQEVAVIRANTTADASADE